MAGGGGGGLVGAKVAKVCFSRGDFLEACFLGERQKIKEEREREKK